MNIGSVVHLFTMRWRRPCGQAELIEKIGEYSIKESVDGSGQEFHGNGSERRYGQADERNG
ncbi:MAG: hypothetical protein NZ789_11545, partial [Pseudomonadales bacterium]|nr:hypothetical protein [Pseudomonadales bacterium]